MSSPLSTVTIDDLASALRRILDSAFAAPEVERAHDLLDRYDVQKKLGIVVAATGWTSAYIVELEEGCWISDGYGDPTRTTTLANARVFPNPEVAGYWLAYARERRPFRNAKVVRVEASMIRGSNG